MVYKIWRLVAAFCVLGTADRSAMGGKVLLWLVVVEAMDGLESREMWKRERAGHAGLFECLAVNGPRWFEWPGWMDALRWAQAGWR